MSLAASPAWDHALGYLLFEVGLLTVWWRLTNHADLDDAEHVAAWLGGQILCTGLLAAVVGGRVPVWLGPLLLAAAWTRRQGMLRAAHVRGWLLVVGLLPLMGAWLRPVHEPDSLFNLHFVFRWLDEGASLYDFAFHYVPFWELVYTPSLHLSRTDAFLWVTSLKAILLLATLLWLIAGELGLTGRLRGLAVANAVLLIHLWHGPSGLATIKNDMIAGAGQVALALAFARMAAGRAGWFERLLLVAGAIFVSTKFSGPALLLLLAPVGMWLLRGRWREHWRWLLGGAVAWVACVGHVYLRNAWVHGNPVYPFAITLGPIRLPGLGDLSNTSILYSLHDAEAWRLMFLPGGWVHPLGLLFPVAFALLPLVMALVVWRGPRVPRVFGLTILASLLVYLRANYSASGVPGDLLFLRNDMNSFRYFEGSYLAGEIFLLARIRHPGLFAVTCTASAVSRVWIMAQRLPADAPPDWAWLAPALALGLTASVLARWRPHASAVAAALLMAAGALMVESRRASWLPQWQALYGPIYDRDESSVFLVVDDEYSEQACLHLPLKGRQLRGDVRTGPVGAIGGEDYAVWLKRAAGEEPLLPHFDAVVRTAAGTLFARTR